MFFQKGCSNSSIYFWNTAKQKRIARIQDPYLGAQQVVCVKHQPLTHGHHLATLSSKELELWDIDKRSAFLSMPMDSGGVMRSARWTWSSGHVLTCGTVDGCRLWDPRTGTSQWNWKIPSLDEFAKTTVIASSLPRLMTSCEPSALDDDLIYCTSLDHLHLVDVRRGAEISRISVPGCRLPYMHVDTRKLIVASENSLIYYDINRLEQQQQLQRNTWSQLGTFNQVRSGFRYPFERVAISGFALNEPMTRLALITGNNSLSLDIYALLPYECRRV